MARHLSWKWFNLRNHVDFWVSFALVLTSLAFFSIHWLTSKLYVSHDAYSLGQHAHDLLQNRIFPFYIYHQFGPHPLITYVQSLVIPVFGYSAASLQGIIVVGGALAAPAIYWASRWLFGDRGDVFSRRAGLISALGWALSTSIASYSLLGVESALLPVIEVAAVAFLWRGLRHGHRLDFVLAGFLVGTSQYVYIVARFFPVALALASAGAILANRNLLTHWRGLIWAATSSALVALPQWILFVTFPFTFVARVSNPVGPIGGQFVFELPDPVAIVATKLTSQALKLCCAWNDSRSALSFDSILTPVLVAGLVVGVAAIILRRHDGYVFGFLMMIMMLLPDLLTYEKQDYSITSYNRLLPGIPFIFNTAGLGIAIIWAWIEKRRRFPHWIAYLVLALILLFSLLQFWDYETRVRSRRLGYQGHDSKIAQIVDYIGNHLDGPILLPASQYRHQRVAFLLTELFPHRVAGSGETLHQEESVTVILLEPNGSADGDFPEEWVLLRDRTVYFLPPMSEGIEPLKGEETELVGSNGDMLAKVFPARWQGELSPFIPLDASFANHLQLVGYQSSSIEPGTPLRLTLYWQPTKKIRRDVKLFVQLLDRSRTKIVATNIAWPLNGAFRVPAWQPDQIMPLSHILSISDDYLPPGEYSVDVGLIDLYTNKLIPVNAVRDEYLVKTLEFRLPEDPRLPEISTKINFENIIQLNGYTLIPTTDGLEIILFWQAIESPEIDYTSFVHIVDSNDQIVAQSDAQPLNGEYPTSRWFHNETVVEERILSFTPNGEYRIYIGWYRHQKDGWKRLSTVAQASSSATDHVLLDTITLP